MFSKTLFSIVLICAVVFANGESESKVPSKERSVTIKSLENTVQAFFIDQGKKIKETAQKVKEDVKFWIDRISGKEHKKDQARIAELQKKLENIQAEYTKKLEDSSIKWQSKIAQLQKELEAAKDADAKEFNAKLEELNEALIESQKENKKLRDAFNAVIEGVQNEIDNAPKSP